MDVSRLDAVLQFALAAASQEDDRKNQELGPIHLIKYVYLADLAFAEKHGGETFTGAQWRFYHFGPWAAEVFERIEPAARAAGAARRTFTSAKYDGEGIRYALTNDAVFERLNRQLPWEVTRSIKSEVHAHGTDTYGLLDHVYRTAPMLRAAPGEYLVLGPEGETASGRALATVSYAVSPLWSEIESRVTAEEDFVPAPYESTMDNHPSWRERREKREAGARLRENVRARLVERRARRPAPAAPAPRYDDVFLEGVKWLESLAGEPVQPGEADAVFSEEIWKSPTRGGRDVP